MSFQSVIEAILRSCVTFAAIPIVQRCQSDECPDTCGLKADPRSFVLHRTTLSCARVGSAVIPVKPLQMPSHKALFMKRRRSGNDFTARLVTADAAHFMAVC
ncbi:hypothetical protein [Stenotrophomonas maltophilia]|uniref:hypothetical protein n=1 Tax=Stenotrophomonas maltophilia TaxID=40324 RepID=UPI002894FC7D|nr:hypothetical protein [Stenotrophomonas maltophilia]MDT3502480.1 hypothetical protein [Stenotrophomonas maltophilia]